MSCGRAIRAGLSIGLTIVALVVGTGCGDNDHHASTFVWVAGKSAPGDACPKGTTEAYRDDGALIVCNSCVTDADCDSATERCEHVCGPGNKRDTGSCLSVAYCIPHV